MLGITSIFEQEEGLVEATQKPTRGVIFLSRNYSRNKVCSETLSQVLPIFNRLNGTNKEQPPRAQKEGIIEEDIGNYQIKDVTRSKPQFHKLKKLF
ncbi:hypothetical protein DGG96_11930 [Legionella qingyii]|uniref:Uncharacterized protein n=1 Tax=Legionella qingyii TaxID=2184757 RepID=A0A317U149_9GAMM|nr:hypothetical protein [Legionella qingyii]PWY55481.1 hypothetical protein DGG96_11930 [Legionella qingyii]